MDSKFKRVDIPDEPTIDAKIENVKGVERATTLSQRLSTALATTPDLPDIHLAVGPEGGWAPDELALFAASGWLPASLGPRILRAETAALAALAVTAALL